jgi:hypothetical protein
MCVNWGLGCLCESHLMRRAHCRTDRRWRIDMGRSGGRRWSSACASADTKVRIPPLRQKDATRPTFGRGSASVMPSLPSLLRPPR